MVKAVSSTVSHPNSFDLFRLQRAREEVGVCINTLREYNKQGLRFYRDGKKVYVSKTELEAHIRAHSQIVVIKEAA